MAASPPDGERFPRSHRITRGPEIRAMFRRGKRSRTGHLDVYASSSPVPHPRAGIVVARYGRPVVARNTVKRRLREIMRREVLPRLRSAGLALDVLVRARREAYEAAYDELATELIDWADRQCSQQSSLR